MNLEFARFYYLCYGSTTIIFSFSAWTDFRRQNHRRQIRPGLSCLGSPCLLTWEWGHKTSHWWLFNLRRQLSVRSIWRDRLELRTSGSHRSWTSDLRITQFDVASLWIFKLASFWRELARVRHWRRSYIRQPLTRLRQPTCLWATRIKDSQRDRDYSWIQWQIEYTPPPPQYVATWR